MVLRDKEKHRIVYSTSIGFRMVFLAIALLILLPLLTFSDGSLFNRANIVALALCAICLLASMFLERWIFDKESNLFEKNVGLLLYYRRMRKPLNTLRKVIISESRRSVDVKTRTASPVSRRTVALYLQDRDGRVYQLDLVRGFGGAEKIRRTAARLSDFCGIPLEDNLRDSDSQTEEAG